jgi:hypothetical protein
MSLNGFSVGKDVEAVARGCIRYLKTGTLGAFEKQPTSVRRTFGPGKADLARRARAKAGLTPGRTAGAALDRVLRVEEGYDDLANLLLGEYIEEKTHPVLPRFVYPHALGYSSGVCQGIHETAGLAGNMAMDFCCPGNTYVVAVADCEVVKLSGHDPSYVLDPSLGIFGWSVHYVSPGGYRWFSTHYGKRFVRVGQRLKRGDAVGLVGWWPNDPGRSHTHLGVTSPHGRADAIRLIKAVAAAPRVRLPV